MAKLTDEEKKERKKIHNAKRTKRPRTCWKKGVPLLTDEEKKERKKIHAARHHKKHREKICKRVAKYCDENREKVSLSRKNQYKNNKETKNAQSKKSYEKHKEKRLHENKLWAEANPEKVREISKRWRKRNPEVASERRALKLDAIPSWLIGCKLERKRLNQMYSLSSMFQKADGIPRHVDHIWPLSDGGPHWSGNLQVLTAKDNMKKGAKVCPIIKKQIQLNLEETKQDGDTN